MNEFLFCGLTLLSLVGKTPDLRERMYSVIAATEHYSNKVMVLAFIESGYDPGAISPVGAVGVMQLMPIAVEETYLENKECDLPPPGKFDYYNPFHNLAVGACYFNFLMAKFNGDVMRAVGAYNAGPSVARLPFKRWPRETRNYWKKFKKYRRLSACKSF